MIIINYKTCKICNKTFPCTTEYFHIAKNNKYGFKNTCKSCTNEKARIYEKQKYKPKKSISTYSKTSHAEYYRKYMSNYKQTDYGSLVVRIAQSKYISKFWHGTSHTDYSPSDFYETLIYFNFSCVYCGRTDVELIPEHLIPLCKGGNWHRDNVLCSCRLCNASKRTTDFNIWYPRYKYFDKDRYNKIVYYVNSFKNSQYYLK